MFTDLQYGTTDSKLIFLIDSLYIKGFVYLFLYLSIRKTDHCISLVFCYLKELKFKQLIGAKDLISSPLYIISNGPVH